LKEPTFFASNREQGFRVRELNFLASILVNEGFQISLASFLIAGDDTCQKEISSGLWGNGTISTESEIFEQICFD